MKRSTQIPEFPRKIKDAKKGDMVLLLHNHERIAFFGEFEELTTFKKSQLFG